MPRPKSNFGEEDTPREGPRDRRIRGALNFIATTGQRMWFQGARRHEVESILSANYFSPMEPRIVDALNALYNITEWKTQQRREELAPFYNSPVIVEMQANREAIRAQVEREIAGKSLAEVREFYAAQAGGLQRF